MSQITLKPLDDGQKAVEIPFGKTTIGRGPFLGCGDKKVSRNHAVLEVTNKGEVFLTPTHVNPCFYKPTSDSPGQILKKDVPCKLENGDTFSLLPRAYRYQLIVGNEPSQSETSNLEDDSKQVGKTNGSAGEDGTATNEEFGDTIVPEKPFTKDDSGERFPQEENTFSKKIAEIKDNGEHNSSEDKEKSALCETSKAEECSKEESKQSVGETPLEADKCKEISEEENGSKELQNKKTKSEANESSDKGYVDADEKSAAVKKAPEENGSEISLDSVPKSNAPKGEGKPEAKESMSIADEKSCEEDPQSSEPVPADSVDQLSSKNLESEPLPDKVDASSNSTKTTKTETTAQAKPKKERQAAKRKAAPEASSKTKGRKKTLKMNFDDAEEGTSRQPGRTSSRTNRQTRQGLSLEDFIVSDDDEWQSDHSEPKPRRRKRGGGKRGEDSGSDWEAEHKKPKKPLHKGWSGSESGSEQSTQRKKKGIKGRRKKEIPNEDFNEVVSEDEPPPSSSGEVKSKTRIPCSYGKKCFRRNVNHKEQFSHPGDSDYTSETDNKPKTNDAISESEEETPKKECPYGANCFRKNPQHKKDFKHTKNVRPQREAAKQADKKAKSSRNSDGIDSYDLNDSFLNDDSADEYKPVDSGSDYESGEKMKRHAKVKGNKSKKGKKL